MKITKQRLKEIIREELAGEGKRTRMTMPALSVDDFGPDLPTYEGEPFGEYDLEAENQKGALAAIAKELGTDPKDPSLWEKILDAVKRADVFPRTEGLGEPGDTPPEDRFPVGDAPERPVPRSWVDGKPPKRPAKN